MSTGLIKIKKGRIYLLSFIGCPVEPVEPVEPVKEGKLSDFINQQTG
jgi:hypothetical protein